MDFVLGKVHESSFIHPEAKIHPSVEIGPFCIVGPNVQMGKGCRLRSHVVIEGHVEIADDNEFYSFCSIGAPPQDLTYKGEPTRVIIGPGNTFREYVSIHRGTMKDKQVTKIGGHCLLMAHVHIGHDVVVEDNCIMANSVNLAGHVHVGKKTIIGGGTNISQFVGIGEGCYVGGASAVDRDIPHHCTAYGNRIKLKGINIVGLRRSGVQKTLISDFVDFYRLMESSPLSPRAFVDEEENLEEFKSNDLVHKLSDFIRESRLGVAPFMS